jgi:hypothetical protein
MNYLRRLTSNCDPPDLHLLSSKDYRCEPPLPGQKTSVDHDNQISLKNDDFFFGGTVV